MIARSLVALALAVSLGLAAPWLSPGLASAGTRAAEAMAGTGTSTAARASRAKLQAAVESATLRHVPGASASEWVLQGLDRSEPRADGTERIVATGVITTPGAPDTRVRLSGRYDPATGRLTRVAYRLQPGDAAVGSTTAAADAPAPGWSVQQAVQRALSAAMPGKDVRFALGSAQSVRLEDGGRRFDGVGISHWAGGDGRFVAFTLSLSPEGEQVSFAFGPSSAIESESQVLAGH